MRARGARKQEILDAVVEHILANGVANLSLRTVAAASGTRARLLIYHFGSKERLVAEAMSALRGRIQASFSEMTGGRADSPGGIMRTFWKWATQKSNAHVLRVFFEVHILALSGSGPYAGYMKESVASWGKLVEASIPPHAGRARRQALARLVVDACDGMLLDFLSTGERRRIEEALEIFAVEIDRLAMEGD